MTAHLTLHQRDNLGENSVDVTAVFIDVVSYSQRTTVEQKVIVCALQDEIKRALLKVQIKFVSTTQGTGLDYLHDTTVTPTGDGALVVFSFGEARAALKFALYLLKRRERENHDPDNVKFDVRTALGCGPVVFFEDYNKHINVAGRTVNDLCRIGAFAPERGILMSEEVRARFIEFDWIGKKATVQFIGSQEVKHGIQLKLFQYLDPTKSYLAEAVPEAGLARAKT